MPQFYFKKYSTSHKFEELFKLFCVQAQLDETKIPENMEDIIEESQDLFLENAVISIKYAYFDIDKTCDDKVYIKGSGNHVLTGTLLPEILKECNKICLYVLNVDGYERISELCGDDIILSYFADAWGTAYAESADNYFFREFVKETNENNLYPTISHNPGQHLFPLTNQKVFFELLQPTELNLRLTDSNLMLPAKSISGVIGISDTPQDLTKVSCDYCNMKKTCRAAYAGHALSFQS